MITVNNVKFLSVDLSYESWSAYENSSEIYTVFMRRIKMSKVSEEEDVAVVILNH